jgi:hypothetical protein
VALFLLKLNLIELFLYHWTCQQLSSFIAVIRFRDEETEVRIENLKAPSTLNNKSLLFIYYIIYSVVLLLLSYVCQKCFLFKY